MARRGRKNGSLAVGKLLRIPLGQIRPYKDQPRKHFDPEQLNELAESMTELGQLEPALLREVEGSTKHGYELVAGERRWQACEKNGTPTLLAIVIGVKDKHDQLERALAANYCREEPPPLDTARALHRLMTQNPRYRSLPVTERRERIGRICGKSGNWVSQKLSLLKLTDEVQKLFDPADPLALPDAAGTFIANNVHEPKQQLAVAKRARDESLSVTQIRRVVRRMAKETGNANTIRQSRPSDDWRFLERFVRNLFDGCETVNDMNERSLTNMLATRTDHELKEMDTMLDLAAGRVSELRDKVKVALKKGKGKSKRAPKTRTRETRAQA